MAKGRCHFGVVELNHDLGGGRVLPRASESFASNALSQLSVWHDPATFKVGSWLRSFR